MPPPAVHPRSLPLVCDCQLSALLVGWVVLCDGRVQGLCGLERGVGVLAYVASWLLGLGALQKFLDLR